MKPRNLDFETSGSLSHPIDFTRIYKELIGNDVYELVNHLQRAQVFAGNFSEITVAF